MSRSNTNTVRPATDPGITGVSVAGADTAAWFNAGVVVAGDVIEWDHHAYTVASGETGPTTRRLVLREVATGRERTIRPRREVRVRLLEPRRDPR